MYRGEMDTNELFNPIPIFENATGDILDNESYQRYSDVLHPSDEIMEQTVRNQEALAIKRGKGSGRMSYVKRILRPHISR